MLQACFFYVVHALQSLNRKHWVRDSRIPDTGDLNRGPKGLKCWTAVWKHSVCWREVLQEPVSVSFKRITVKNEALKFLTILLIGKTIAILFRWSVFQYLFLLSLKLQFLMMMLKYFTFYHCSRRAHIRLLLKFLFKILVVLSIKSNLYVVKTMWLHFLSGQLCLFFIPSNFTSLNCWIFRWF